MTTLRLRIDEIQETPASFRVRFTVGEPPLSLDPSGNEREFASRTEFSAWINAIVPSDDLMLAGALGPTFKANPQMTSLSSFTGKYFQLDLTGAASMVQTG